MTLVRDSGLSTRTINALERGGYYTMDDVCVAGPFDLRRLPEFGDRAAREVEKWAEEQGKVAGLERWRMQRMLDAMEKRAAILERDIGVLRQKLSA